MPRPVSHLRPDAGFTLIELAMVIVLLGIMASIAIAKYIDLQREARIAVLHAMQGVITTAASLVHNKAVVMGLDLTDPKLDVDLDGDGTDERLIYGYPKRNHGHTMEWMIASMGDFTYINGGFYRLRPNCQVDYADPNNPGEMPQIGITDSGC
ncbi:MAG: prepilin-type N-terminal cleavage/methylation domain-containing protein [Gammaproteobacteria bacterium]|nr:prepilin-type N-terminal cleavage/methylation domain-containing protein [Gammaproteobacteria bacterium]MCW8841325.1 prepilin-type N-terminal cleavage/methylation domain-containing protein [Gammaproteobacteria bacterium]MCW8927836.1 prepilin-type N-terminal cleavage/methylation domain-containing protein [Gammaproteobacteria bacterium]MCW8959417.1 prepilin-type N-terminal cleavage/methylation domain-containing protein [Gammaproteobacteria bacterium]MCW8971971.1 prepilin-type N-terminal cleavag